jgi:hypothetical protein
MQQEAIEVGMSFHRLLMAILIRPYSQTDPEAATEAMEKYNIEKVSRDFCGP